MHNCYDWREFNRRIQEPENIFPDGTELNVNPAPGHITNDINNDSETGPEEFSGKSS